MTNKDGKQKAPEFAGRRITRHHSKPHSCTAEGRSSLWRFLWSLQFFAFKAIPSEKSVLPAHTKQDLICSFLLQFSFGFVLPNWRHLVLMSRLQVIEDYKPGSYVCMPATYTSTWYAPYLIHAHISASSTVSLQKPSPKSGTAVYVSLEMTPSPFLTSSQGYNHRQGHSVSKYIQAQETAITAAAAAPLHFYIILKKHEYEPEQQQRAI